MAQTRDERPRLGRRGRAGNHHGSTWSPTMPHAFVHLLGLAGQPHRPGRVAAATPKAKHPHAPAEVMPPARRPTSAARDTVPGAANPCDVEPAIAGTPASSFSLRESRPGAPPRGPHGMADLPPGSRMRARCPAPGAPGRSVPAAFVEAFPRPRREPAAGIPACGAASFHDRSRKNRLDGPLRQVPHIKRFFALRSEAGRGKGGWL